MRTPLATSSLVGEDSRRLFRATIDSEQREPIPLLAIVSGQASEANLPVIITTLDRARPAALKTARCSVNIARIASDRHARCARVAREQARRGVGLGVRHSERVQLSAEEGCRPPFSRLTTAGSLGQHLLVPARADPQMGRRPAEP